MELLQRRLGSTEEQLQFAERQLRALTSAPASRSSSPSPGADQGAEGSRGQPQLGALVEQLQRVLEVKEERIR